MAIPRYGPSHLLTVQGRSSLPLLTSLPKALSKLHPLQMAFRHFLECTPIKAGSLFTDVSLILTTVPDSQNLLRISVCLFMNQGMN